MGKLRPPYIGWSALQGVREISSCYHSVRQKMQTNLFQQEESLLAPKTKHLGVVLVSGMARFWTQSKAQFPWCVGTIHGWVCFLLRLWVARVCGTSSPILQVQPSRKEPGAYKSSPETHSDWLTLGHVFAFDEPLLPGTPRDDWLSSRKTMC